MKFIFISSFLFLFFTWSASDSKIIEISSPDGSHQFKLQTHQSLPSYRVFFQNKLVIDNSALGFELENSKDIFINTKVKTVTKNSVDYSWKPVYGEKNFYTNKYNEITISFVSRKNDKPVVKLCVRAYNEGIAFRYEIEQKEKTVIRKELTGFTFTKDADVWVSNRAQSEIVQKKVSKLENEIVERPLLAKINKSLFVALGEANLIDFARMKFKKDPIKTNTLIADLDGEVVFNKSFKSPWRVIMAGESEGKILENNYLFLNLCEPSKLKSTDWIKPGKVLREVSLTTQGGMACVDFASKHNIQYVEFDAGWYGKEFDKRSDASKVNVDPNRSPGPLDLQQIINYATKNNVGIILYVNQNALDTQIDKILPLYKKWGIKGVKYGFVNVGSQKATKWLHNAVKKAAENQLMVDIHDEYRPTGLSRTYPNLMTQEGIRGDEETPDNSHSLKTLFTRMIAGAADNTNCYFADRVDKKMGSHVSQMAKTILIYSPWQFIFWYDRPEASPQRKGGAGNSARVLRETPDLQFYDDLPTVWDDTKVLEGKIGTYATIARKSKNDWFIGSITDQPRKVKISFDFLDKDAKYQANVYQDNEILNTLTKAVIIKEIEINSKTILDFQLGHKKGLAIVIKKEK